MTPRPARPDEVSALAAIEAGGATHPWSVDAIASALRSPTTRARVIGDPAVGHVLYTVVADEGEILTIAVLPAHRRTGLGRALVGAVLTDWRDSGVVAGFLEVRRDNAGARALYAGCGFAETGIRRGYYVDGEDAIVGRWSP